MEEIKAKIAAYVLGVQKLLGGIWEIPIEEAMEKDEPTFFLVSGGIVGAIVGVVAYLAIVSKQGFETYPILAIISLAVGAGVGVGAGRIAYGIVLFVFRLALSGLIIVVPPLLVILLLRLIVTVVKFLFTPL